jgi:anti-sigma factor RsiW
MNCSKTKKKLSAYLDGEISEQERHMISEHLKLCSECQAELAAMSSVSDALETLEGFEVPPFFITRLRQGIREQERPVPFFKRIRSVAISTATALGVIISLFIGNQAGRTIYQAIARAPEPVEAETNEVFGVGAFEEFPEGSLSDIYSELVTGGNNG